MSSIANQRNVVVTGLGLLSPLGIGFDQFSANLRAGNSGISKITLFSWSGLPGHVGGEVKGFTDKTSKEFIKERKSIKAMCRDMQLGVAAAGLAMSHSGLDESSRNPERLGVEFGANLMLSPPSVLRDAVVACVDPTGTFQHPQWGTEGIRKMEPKWLLQYLPNLPASHIGIFEDARGPNNSLTMAEASFNLAVCEALRILWRDKADVMIVGATGTTLHPVQSIHSVLWDELATPESDPTTSCRPFDKRRTGQVVAEGSASIILEEEGHAVRRGAKIYGRILGAGSACVSHRPGIGDSRKALVGAMKKAFRDARMEPKQIGHINAHGLGCKNSDIEESLAIREIFGDLSDKVPLTSFKSYWGNPGSSCGGLEFAGSIVGLLEGVVLPTRNYQIPDPECPVRVVHGEPLPVENRNFLSINVTRQGQASALIARGAD